MEIEFDDEVHALIILASLPNSCEAMRMTVSNSTGKTNSNMIIFNSRFNFKRRSLQERCEYRQCTRSSFCHGEQK